MVDFKEETSTTMTKLIINVTKGLHFMEEVTEPVWNQETGAVIHQSVNVLIRVSIYIILQEATYFVSNRPYR